MKLVFHQDLALLYALKDSLPFCVWPGPHYLLFLQLKPTMAKTRSDEQCVGHRGRGKEKKRKEKSTTTKARDEYLLRMMCRRCSCRQVWRSIGDKQCRLLRWIAWERRTPCSHTNTILRWNALIYSIHTYSKLLGFFLLEGNKGQVTMPWLSKTLVLNESCCVKWEKKKLQTSKETVK